MESLGIIQNLQQISISVQGLTTFNTQKQKSLIEVKMDPTVEFLMNLPDELDALIGERRFSEAVDSIKQGKSLLAGYQRTVSTLPLDSLDSLNKSIEKREKHLAEHLTNDLANPTLKKNDVRRIIGLLLELNMGEEARDVFFETKSKFIESQIRKIRFGGDVKSYISELSRIVFSAIKTTGADYRHCFPSTTAISEFIVWSIRELERYGNIFRRQVFYSNDTQTISECVELAKLHFKVLEEKGLAFITFTTVISKTNEDENK
jgi:hypothetical protein